jgi:hypothetical protein
MSAFGAASTRGWPSQWCQDCQVYTFDSFAHSWLALLQITEGNNWNAIMWPNVFGSSQVISTLLLTTAMPLSPFSICMPCAGTQSWWGSIYFVLYRFFITDVFVNIVESVVIQSYAAQQVEAENELADARLADVLRANASPPVASDDDSKKNGDNDVLSAAPAENSTASEHRVPPLHLVPPLPLQHQHPSSASLAESAQSRGLGGGRGRPSETTASPARTLQRHIAERWQRQLFADLSGGSDSRVPGSSRQGRISGASGGVGMGWDATTAPRVFGVPPAELRLLEIALRAQEDKLSTALAAAVEQKQSRQSPAPGGSSRLSQTSPLASKGSASVPVRATIPRPTPVRAQSRDAQAEASAVAGHGAAAPVLAPPAATVSETRLPSHT